MNLYGMIAAIVGSLVTGMTGVWAWLKIKEQSKFTLLGHMEETIASNKAEADETAKNLKVLECTISRLTLDQTRLRANGVRYRVLFERINDFLKELDPVKHNGRLSSLNNEIDTAILQLMEDEAK